MSDEPGRAAIFHRPYKIILMPNDIDGFLLHLLAGLSRVGVLIAFIVPRHFKWAQVLQPCLYLPNID